MKRSARPTTAKANPRTLCLSSPGVSLDAEDGHFLLRREEEGGGPVKLPTVAVRQILVEHGGRLRTRAARLALLAEVPVSFFGPHGELLGHLQPPLAPRIDLRLAQYRTHAHAATRLALARRFVEAKLEATVRALGDGGWGFPGTVSKQAIVRLRGSMRRVGKAPDLETLRGLEGVSAKAWFEALAGVLSGAFAGRSRRPPRDPGNALLSYGYAVLVRDLSGKLELAGLDPYVGYLHEPGYRSPALALDLAEPLRISVIDRIAVSIAPRLGPEEFEVATDGGIRLGRGAKAAFFSAYEAAVCSRDATRTAEPGGSLLADKTA